MATVIRVPLGKAIKFTNQQLDQLSAMTPERLAVIQERASLLWKRYAPAEYKTLLDAKPVGEESDSDFAWDVNARKYVNKRTGRVIPPKEIRAALDECLMKIKG